MDAHVTVAFLESVVLPNVVQVIPTYDDCTLHLHLLYNASENASSDRNVPSERTLLVDVGTLQGLCVKYISIECAPRTCCKYSYTPESKGKDNQKLVRIYNLQQIFRRPSYVFSSFAIF